ncbi:MAG: DUF58 domain-containing protein, partial [Gammaproteobacteria bacterium]|nr:DUF58 domain-containing protein [Gammaproteobacteria bacterium]
TRVAFKSVVAAKAAALLAWSAADKGDRVGGLVFDERGMAEYRPAARTRGLLPLLNGLAGFADRADATSRGATVGDVAVSLSAAVAHLTQLVRPGSLVFLISDFASLGEADGAWVAHLASASELVFIQVSDTLEQAPPPAARYPVVDGDTQALIDTAGAGLREAWVARFAARERALERLCRQYQA